MQFKTIQKYLFKLNPNHISENASVPEENERTANCCPRSRDPS